MVIEVDLKVIVMSLVKGFMWLFIGASCMAAYMSISKFNSIGNDSYIAHYSTELRNHQKNMSLEASECIAKYSASSTKEKFEGYFGAFAAGSANFFSWFTFGLMPSTELGNTLKMKYPLLLTENESTFFGEKCYAEHGG